MVPSLNPVGLSHYSYYCYTVTLICRLFQASQHADIAAHFLRSEVFPHASPCSDNLSSVVVLAYYKHTLARSRAFSQHWKRLFPLPDITCGCTRTLVWLTCCWERQTIVLVHIYTQVHTDLEELTRTLWIPGVTRLIPQKGLRNRCKTPETGCILYCGLHHQCVLFMVFVSDSQ